MGDSGRTKRYRRLQAWYREHQLGIGQEGEFRNGRVSSMLPTSAVAEQPSLNFLVPGAHAHAEARMLGVRREGGTLDDDRLRRNLLSSMPVCFNLFGAIGNHPAFADLLRLSGIAPSAVAVLEVTCEWAPRPAADHLADRTAFDAYIRYRAADGSVGFVGVETKYTEDFSSTSYDRPEYRDVTANSGWFTEGAADVLVGPKTNQVWRMAMLAASLEGTGSAGSGSVAVVSLQDDPAAASCVAEVRSQLRDPDRLVHVTYEAIVAGSTETGDPDLIAWAARFRHRYLDVDDIDGRSPDPTGPRFGDYLRSRDREPPRRREPEPQEIEALSWRLAAALVERHPTLRVVESHPGGGQYDCLSIGAVGGANPLIDLNRVGSIHVWSDQGATWAWRDPWGEMDEHGDVSFGVRLLEHHAALGRPVPAGEAFQAHVLAYRFIAAFLGDEPRASGSPSRRRRATYRFGDGNWSGLPIPPPDFAVAGPWVLYERDEIAFAVDDERGLAAGPDGETIDLRPMGGSGSYVRGFGD